MRFIAPSRIAERAAASVAETIVPTRCRRQLIRLMPASAELGWTVRSMAVRVDDAPKGRMTADIPFRLRSSAHLSAARSVMLPNCTA
jgi:hypothetical protein